MHLVLATDWATISSVVTGVATLVLAFATFAAVRSSNRSARIAEAALQEQRRPVLVQSRFDDPIQKIMFVEGHWITAAGGCAAVEHVDGIVYLGANLRNVGSGIGVCQAWTARAEVGTTRTMPTHAPLEAFRLQSRDLYIPSGDVGMWQGALRNPDDAVRAALAEAIDARETLTLEILYTDQIGQQRTVTRFGLVPSAERWLVSVTRHWYLDWDGPRPEGAILQAVENVLRDQDALHERRSAGGADGALGRPTDGAPAEQGTPGAGADR